MTREGNTVSLDPRDYVRFVAVMVVITGLLAVGGYRLASHAWDKQVRAVETLIESHRHLSSSLRVAESRLDRLDRDQRESARESAQMLTEIRSSLAALNKSITQVQIEQARLRREKPDG